jgi:hypothetical protein
MNNAILRKRTRILFIVTPIAFNASRKAGYQSLARSYRDR